MYSGDSPLRTLLDSSVKHLQEDEPSSKGNSDSWKSSSSSVSSVPLTLHFMKVKQRTITRKKEWTTRLTAITAAN